MKQRNRCIFNKLYLVYILVDNHSCIILLHVFLPCLLSSVRNKSFFLLSYLVPRNLMLKKKLLKCQKTTWSPNWRKFRKETFHTLYWIAITFWVFCSQYFGDRFQIFWLKNFNQRKHYVLCREKKYLRKKNVLLVTPKLSPSKIGKTLRLTSTTDFFLIKNSFFKFYLQKTLGIFNSNKNCHM